jgi:hypothetical protein
MELHCPKSLYPITLACATRIGTNSCRIVIANDDILQLGPWSYEVVFRHERGHCHSWPAHHPGARGADAPIGKPIPAWTINKTSIVNESCAIVHHTKARCELGLGEGTLAMGMYHDQP